MAYSRRFLSVRMDNNSETATVRQRYPFRETGQFGAVRVLWIVANETCSRSPTDVLVRSCNYHIVE